MGILDIFRNNGSKLHSEDVRERVRKGREIVEKVLKDNPGYRVGRQVYSYHRNDLNEQITSTEAANQGGFEISRIPDEKIQNPGSPQALVHFETGFPNRPIIFVKGGMDPGVAKSILKALQKEGEYKVFKPHIQVVDRKHSLSVDHFYDSRIRTHDGQSKPRY
ncbi:MAG: hypothetical protein WCX64_06980 [Candidatus Micrarchaeia archaeon]